MWRTHDGLGWMMLLGAVFWILILGLVTYLVTSHGTGRSAAPVAPPDPLEIARRRYATGQISRERFLALCADLTAPPGDVPHEVVSGDRADQ
jgi:uncharacterized membrane protein